MNLEMGQDPEGKVKEILPLRGSVFTRDVGAPDVNGLGDGPVGGPGCVSENAEVRLSPRRGSRYPGLRE